MNGYRDRLDAISRLLTDILGDKVDVVTDGMADIQAGRTSILIDPPDLEWDRWADPETTWTITVLSGVSWKQPDALEKVFDIIGILSDSQRVNLRKGVPATCNVLGGEIAGYALTLNPTDY